VLTAIVHRTWPALRELDEEAANEVTKPAIEALEAMPGGDHLRRATADVVVLERG
jgi:hypothetical protein